MKKILGFFKNISIKKPIQKFGSWFRGAPLGKRIFAAVLMILFIGGLIIFGVYALGNYIERMQKVTVGNVSLTLYYSRGSRDDKKIEKNSFSVNDPIQLMIEFENAKEGTVFLYRLSKDSGDILQEVEVPVSGTSSRYVTISSSGNYLTQGKYRVEVFQSGYLLEEETFGVE